VSPKALHRIAAVKKVVFPQSGDCRR
jgi:hypothetical protein